MTDERASLLILVATMTGTAEILAEDLEQEIGDRLDVRIELLEETEVESLASERLALVVSSTYGTGDVPETAEQTWRALGERAPDLSDLSYGVISLGDSGYPDTFAQGGEKWDRALAACGAARVGEILRIDCKQAEEPLEPATRWLDAWLAAALGAQNHTPGAAAGCATGGGPR